MLNLRLKIVPSFIFLSGRSWLAVCANQNDNCPFMLAGFFPTVFSESIACYQFPSQHCCGEDIML